jgi:hypothetical protein
MDLLKSVNFQLFESTFDTKKITHIFGPLWSPAFVNALSLFPLEQFNIFQQFAFYLFCKTHN